MRGLKLYCLLLAACFVLALPGISLASPVQEQQTIAVSKSDLMTLIENNEKQQKALEQSATALTKAQKALETSQTALTEAKTTLTASQAETQTLRQALTESQQETKALQKELSQQKEQTQQLQSQLQTLKIKSTSAENSIAEAQKSLDDTRAEFLKTEKAHERTENRLKNRIKAWQIVAAICGGIALTR
nr:hypothetical protein [Mitsuokella multacida]